jgi:DNA polymerase-1
MVSTERDIMQNTLYILDGHGLIYRAYYAFINRPLITTKGENTSAIFGFMRMLLKLLQDEEPSHLVCAFDPRGKTFRHERFPEYKAKRMKAPEDLHVQGELIKRIVEKLGITRVEVEGFEADDVIGTLSSQATALGMKTVILSGDKDILQLVDESVSVYTSKKGISEVEVLHMEEVEAQWGVRPGQMIDLFALMGDQSDNIPGVRGIGKATAIKLIQQFGSLDEIYDRIEEVDRERTRKLLMEGREDALLSRDLVTIRRDAPITFDTEGYRLDEFPREEGITMLSDRELGSIVAVLRGSESTDRIDAWEAEQKRGQYRIIDTIQGFREIEEKIRKKGVFSFDTESTGRNAVGAEIIGFSISVEEGEGSYIPIRNREGTGLGEEFLRSTLKPLLEDRHIEKKGQNIKYDYVILRKYGIDMRGISGDSMIAAYLINPPKGRYSIDDLASEYLDYRTIHYSDVVKEKDQTLLDYSIDEVVEYACEDSDIALRLVNLLERKLDEEKLGDLYREIEVPLLVVLGKMEAAGVRVDADYLEAMSKRFGQEIEEVEREVFSLAGEVFNVRSTKQLGTVLFEKLELPIIKRTKTGYSTDESVLEELALSYDIARQVLRHRTLSKLKSTYVDSLPEMINPRTGRIHTSFNQTIAATGRLSSNAPNLQNIPIREKEGRAIRSAFIPEKGWCFLSADYSQIELRILASLSEDETLIAAFKNNQDIHRETAAIMFGVDVEAVTDLQRQAAKTINFSIIYGISPFGLSRRLGISRSEASKFIDMYFQQYSGVKRFFDGVVSQVKENGYVETLLGRRRYVPEINSKNRNIAEAARRVAINTPIQGTAADLIKKAMVQIDAEMDKQKMRSRMLIQVHDELVFETPPEECEDLQVLVREAMENALSFHVPLKVNLSVGSNWEEVH